MTMNVLKQVADARFPVSFYGSEDIDSVRLLRAAGLVVALVPSPSDPLALSGPASAAQVLAITQKGREELERIGHLERSHSPRWKFQAAKTRAPLHSSASRAQAGEHQQ